MPQPAAGEVQIPQDWARPVPRQAGAGAAVNALGPRPAAGQVGEIAAAGQVGQLLAVGQVGQETVAGQTRPLPAARQVGQIAAAGKAGQLTAEEKLQVNWDLAYFRPRLSALCCVVAEAILLVTSGRLLSLFRFLAWLGHVTFFAITSVKLVSRFFEVCPFGGWFLLCSPCGWAR